MEMTKDQRKQQADKNKIICLFMGDREYVWKTHYPDWAELEAQLLDLEDVYFHSSWDWLMPVVEKIETLWNNGFNVYIGPFECIIRRQRTSPDSELCQEVDIIHYTPAEYTINSKIEACYTAVLKFINWYNNQK